MVLSTLPTASALCRAAVLLDAAARWGEPGFAVRLEAAPGALCCAVLPLPRGVHPLTLLTSLALPAGCSALGLLVEGRGYELGASGLRHRGMIRCVHLVALDGTEVSATRVSGEQLVVRDGAGIEGRIPDALRRAAAAHQEVRA